MATTSQALTAEDLRLVAWARRDLNNLRAFVRRTGLTGWVNRDATYAYSRAFRAVVRVEDALGTEHPAAVKLGDRLRVLYDEARDAGLLTPEQIIEAEKDALR